MNVLENFLAGRQARREQDAADASNAMNGFLQQNGQALFNGDQNALGQLAGMGPEGLQQAFGIRGQQQQDQRAQAQDARASVSDQREEWRYQKEVEQYAAGISEQEAAAAAAQVEKSIKVALAAQTPEQFDALMAQMGQPDLVGQFDNRDALAAQYIPMVDILKQRAGPEWRPATSDEAAQYGAAGGQIDTSSGKFDPINPPSNGVTIRNPDGTETIIGGPAGGGKPFTEGQSKDIGFATRARAAITTLEPIANSLTDRKDIFLDSPMIPMGIGREYQSEGFQVAGNAAKNLMLAILRKDTGAAVTPTEERMYGEVFLPQPGDGEALLAQKAQARELAVSGLEQGMSPDAILAQGRAILQATGDAPADATVSPKVDVAPPKRMKFNPETGAIE